jgi:predicted nucleic acid-binding protein
VIIADTSAWVEFLRGTHHRSGLTLRRLIHEDAELAVTELVVMELLAGATSPAQLRQLRSRLIAFPILQLQGLVAFEEASLLYRTCREAGETIRSFADCLIAVPAIRARAAVLHNDADFDTLSRHSELEVHQPDR